MSFVHIKKQMVQRSQGSLECYVVPAMAITTPQGKKLIPNPNGQETVIFETFEEAELSVQRAGFDYIFEGQKSYTLPPQKTEPKIFSPKTTWQDAIPLLIARLHDREPSVISHAAFALGELGALDAMSSLIELLGHEDGSVRKEVAEALAKMGSPAIPLLQVAYEEAKKSREKNVSYTRLTIMTVYLQMARTHREVLNIVIPHVMEALSDESWLVRSQAALVVGHVAQSLNRPEEKI